MFDTRKAFSSFAVPDTTAAKTFYGDTLGIDVSEEGEILGLELTDDRHIMVYPKVDHSPAAYTVLNFEVDDIEAAVDALAESGVEVTHYAGTATDTDTDEKGIFRVGDLAQAWFTDPAGNILSVLQPTGASQRTTT